MFVAVSLVFLRLGNASLIREWTDMYPFPCEVREDQVSNLEGIKTKRLGEYYLQARDLPSSENHLSLLDLKKGQVKKLINLSLPSLC